jgi:hypothetical protein
VGQAQDGTTESAALSIWTVEKPTFTLWAGWPVPAGCTVDPERDALLPAEVTLTNTSTGFNAELAFFLDQAAPSLLDGKNLLSEITFADGSSQCGSGTDSDGDPLPILSFGSSDSVASGGTVSSMFYFVVPGYYSPDLPQGNTQLLNQYVLRASMTSTSVGYNITQGSGPGYDSEYGFTLNGSSSSAAYQADYNVP